MLSQLDIRNTTSVSHLPKRAVPTPNVPGAPGREVSTSQHGGERIFAVAIDPGEKFVNRTSGVYLLPQISNTNFSRRRGVDESVKKAESLREPTQYSINDFHHKLHTNMNEAMYSDTREMDCNTLSIQKGAMCQLEAALTAVRTTDLVHYVDDWLYTVAHCSKSSNFKKSTVFLESRPAIWDSYVEIIGKAYEDDLPYSVEDGDFISIMGALLMHCTQSDIEVVCYGEKLKSVTSPKHNIHIEGQKVDDLNHMSTLMGNIQKNVISIAALFLAPPHFVTYSAQCDKWFDSSANTTDSDGIVSKWTELRHATLIKDPFTKEIRNKEKVPSYIIYISIQT